MKINDDHLYHGAALTQVAEHPQFTAINAFKNKAGISRSAFKVNDDIGLYLKYASTPKGTYNEYVFTFTVAHFGELRALQKKSSSVYLALVCVKDRHICALSLEQLEAMVAHRRSKKGGSEEQYTILVVLETGKSFRVYVNAPGTKKTMLGKPLVVKRKDFPNRLFE